ncbi:hypothetical protein VP1G_04800 [Cytospora mali]|uniref:Kelch repeat-containing protein n=1 Tax=Cytospora mali TaxID=578113 RepID=A0A194V0R7_CYTMA|nr:hypothetical protein VP1G_04800 [Valsa mali var. pyri (nom. inval.)]
MAEQSTAVLQDMLYMDGGYLYWTPGYADGSFGPATQDNNPLGLVYTLNFSTPFNMTQNISSVFNTFSKVGSGAATNIAPNHFDGALLANDDEFFLYGGLPNYVDAFDATDGDSVWEYQRYQYGVTKDGFRPSFQTVNLPNSLTPYIAYGGAANVPSENKAFYFSGMQSPDHGPIYYPGGNDSLTAVNVSDTLITLDMSTQNAQTWTNVTLPDSIPGRANPELVWVPVGSQGILVALGGVVYPEFINPDAISDNETASENQSPAFMSNINIYDIAGGKWYTQPTTGGPSTQLTRGCAVMQPSQDYSSFNIYYYGGYDGLHNTNASVFKDDVWVLSLPSFMWMKVASGRSGHGRAGHKCVMPYPDQMMVIGGQPAQPGDGGPSCVNGGFIELFNVSSSQWLDRYDPSVWSAYQVPSMIYQMIGGDEYGGASSTTPAPTGWATQALASVFATSYPTSKITTYYPYAVATNSSSPLPTYTSPHSSGGGGTSVPKFLPPLLGVILGLILVSFIVVGILVWRRRKYLKKNGGMSEMTDENGHRILSWIRGQPTDNKAPTITTTDDLTRSPEPEHLGMYAPHAYQPQMQQQLYPHEIGGTQLAELQDTSPFAELSDTALTPVDIMEKHSHFGSSGNNASSRGNPSLAYSSLAATDHASMVSSNSAAAGGVALASSARNLPSQPQQVRSDSPSLPEASTHDNDHTPGPSQSAAAGTTTTTTNHNRNNDDNDNDDDNTPTNVSAAPPPQQAPRGESGVSAFTERDRSHLRQLSDPATVSTMDDTVVGSPRLAPQQAGGVVGRPILEEGTMDTLRGQPLDTPPAVVSPPTAGEIDGEDYISSRSRSVVVSPVNQTAPHGASSSPARRSIFRESREDMGGSH